MMASLHKTTPVVITAGDPAGVGPDLCVNILHRQKTPVVIIGDRNVLAQRADMLGIPFNVKDEEVISDERQEHTVWHCPTAVAVCCGKLSPDNSAHTLEQLQRAANGCLSGRFRAMVTAPISKSIINAAGVNFAGVTEYVADIAKTPHPVMLLAGEKMKVALASRHLPLAQVAQSLTEENLLMSLQILDKGLRQYWDYARAPHIAVAGLNPHAGEGGYLGDEEIRIITPAIMRAKAAGVNATGPYSADSMFCFNQADCFMAMYHDQGLPIIKYADFENTINITLGLPFLRVSPDHGTAATLAGKKNALSLTSMYAALRMAATV